MSDAPTVPTPAVPVAPTTAAKPVSSPPGSRFDNRLFKQLKLTEVPSFLWENAGWNGFFRFQIFMKRNLSSVGNPDKKFAMRWPLLVLSILMTPGLIGAYSKQTRARDALIRAKYGDDFEKMSDIEKDYVKKQVTQLLQSNR